MHILFCLVCHGIYTLYLGILNPNSFSLFLSLLFLLLYAKRIMLVSCLVSIQLYKNGNTNIQFGFFSLYHRLRPSIVILRL